MFSGAGKLSFNLRGLQKAVSQLAFDKLTMSELTPIDPMEILGSIGQYPWRPATEKVVVLLTCTECGSKKVRGGSKGIRWLFWET